MLTRREVRQELGGAGALGKNAISDFTIIRDRRDARYEMRNRARNLANSVPAIQALRLRGGQWQAHRLATCGKSMRGGVGAVSFRENADTAGITDLQSCGSYACPVCGPKIANRRFEEVKQVLTVARAEGYEVAMVTMTLRHKVSDRLEDLWDGLLAGWREAITSKDWVGERPEVYAEVRADWECRGALYEKGQGRAPRGWKKQKGIFRAQKIGKREEFGVLAQIRAVELTRGANGWHPHIHALFIFKPESNLRYKKLIQAQAIGSFFHEQYQEGLALYGLESWEEKGGLKVDLMKGTAEDIARYATKMALEATRSDLKRGRDGGETPNQLLARAVEGEEDAVNAWRDFAVASQGRRWLVIPQKLRELAQLGREKSDAEIAEEETPGFIVARVPADVWMKKRVWLVASTLLRSLEEGGPEALYAEFRARGIFYLMPNDDSHRPPLE